jgi:hypothetical protein
MVTAWWCIVVAFAPILALWLITRIWNWAPWALRSASRSANRCSALSPPIERLGRELHRLTVDYARTEHANEPGKANRLRATSIAYDDLLLAACTALEVPVPQRSGHELLEPIERLTVEAELARAGLNW